MITGRSSINGSARSSWRCSRSSDGASLRSATPFRHRADPATPTPEPHISADRARLCVALHGIDDDPLHKLRRVGQCVAMNESWTVNRDDFVARAQAIWDALAVGDPAPVLESQASGVIFDNGPGAGPWRHTEGQAAFLDMIGAFFPIFGGSFRQAAT